MTKCVVWGIRTAGQLLASEAAYVGYEVVAYCSAFKEEQGMRIKDLPVISPAELKEWYAKDKTIRVILGIKNPIFLNEVEELLRSQCPADMQIIDPGVIESDYLIKVRQNLQYRWNVDFKAQAEIWIQNFMSEVAYWVNEVADPAATGSYRDDYLKRLDNKSFTGIDSSCSELAEQLQAGAVVMDIGCGLASKYGTELPNSESIRLLAVDPLAAFYRRISQKYSNGKGTPCKFGLFEFIANYYEEGFCDAILINNALDHCIDPYKSIVECLYILKSQGRMRLTHRCAEAVFEAYNGLHKWNIDYNEQNEFIIWNQENAMNVSKELQRVAEIRVSHTDDCALRREQSVVVEIIKKQDFNLDEFFDMKKERQDLAFLFEKLMDWVSSGEEKYLGDRT